MSRIGKQPIAIPKNTEVSVSSQTLKVKGPLGELTRTFSPLISIEVAEDTVLVNPKKENLFTRALWGTTASHIRNMVKGVHTIFQKRLIIEGVGYRAEVSGNNLVLQLGFSHPVKIPIPGDVKVTVEKNVMTISSINKESVGQFTASVRALKKPEPYKGKGIRYENEVLRRKQGKRAV
ncbi:MAG: 50S ribosomal protein L6 [bacterium]|nr:50S ribosomal protein L6 [bacterium]